MKNIVKNSLFLLLAIVFLLPSFASASSYYVYDVWGGTYSDAEKTYSNTDDDLMCWAAAASNILYWTGWGNVSSEDFSSADDIFNYYQYYWTDDGGNSAYAWNWWFTGNGVSENSDGWSYVEYSDGGDFYNQRLFSQVFRYSVNTSKIMEDLNRFFNMGYGVTCSLTRDGESGHMVSVWGYEYDEAGNYVGIYVTDSDDDKSSDYADDVLAYYDIVYGTVTSGEDTFYAWFLQDFYGTDSYYVTGLYALALAPEALRAVPVPAGIFLLGSGLIAVSGIRRFRM